VGLRGKVFGSQGGYRGGFCEKLPEASPMSNRANASRLQDRPAKAERISDSGSTSGITYSRRGEKNTAIRVRSETK